MTKNKLNRYPPILRGLTRDLVAAVEASGRTQRDVCRDAGLSEDYVSQIKQGRVLNPGVDALESLVATLGGTVKIHIPVRYAGIERTESDEIR